MSSGEVSPDIKEGLTSKTSNGLLSIFLAAVLLAGLATCRGASKPVGRLEVEPKVIRLGYPQSVWLRLKWQPTGPLDKLHGTPKVFVHLLERPGKVMRTFDHSLPREWKPGQPQSYEIELYQSALGESLPPGTYPLSIGLYDDGWGYRWPLEVDGEDIGKREYRVATVEVPPLEKAGPGFEFSGGWLPTDPGVDRQVLARRWLAGPGTILVKALRGAGTVRLGFSIPAPAPGALEVGRTAAAGEVELAGSCLSGKSDRRGPGRHELSLPRAAGGDDSCEIQFVPASASAAPPRLLCLELAAWRPDP